MDTAVKGCECVRRVFAAKRIGADVNMEFGRDIWLEVVTERHWERGYVETSDMGRSWGRKKRGGARDQVGGKRR